MLRNSDQSISGQELCNHFGVSRTAVWKAINQLKEDGYEIEAVQNRGYRLISCPEILSKVEIASRLQTKWAGRTLYYYDETGSTNTDVKRLAEEGAPHGTLVVADLQTAGRGRKGRNWESPAGTTISMSLLLRPEFAPDHASGLTLVMALAVAKALAEVCETEFKIKWPNDIVLNNKKVCGILTEMSAELDYIHYVVIGIGINVNLMQFPDDIKDMATSVLKETGQIVSRSEIVERVLYYFEKYYETYLKTLDLSGLSEEYNAILVNRDRMVRVLDPKGQYQGTARGITSDGELIVEKEDGSTVQVYAGEVSVRGLYGYAE